MEETIDINTDSVDCFKFKTKQFSICCCLGCTRMLLGCCTMRASER